MADDDRTGQDKAKTRTAPQHSQTATEAREEAALETISRDTGPTTPDKAEIDQTLGRALNDPDTIKEAGDTPPSTPDPHAVARNASYGDGSGVEVASEKDVAKDAAPADDK